MTPTNDATITIISYHQLFTNTKAACGAGLFVQNATLLWAFFVCQAPVLNDFIFNPLVHIVAKMVT